MPATANDDSDESDLEELLSGDEAADLSYR